MRPKKKTTQAETLAERIVGGTLSQMATYSDLFDNTTDAIFLVDLDTFQVLECNPAVKALLGVSPNILQGDDLLKWVDPSSQTLLEAQLKLIKLKKGSDKPFDTVFTTDTGKKLVLEISSQRLKLADYAEVIQVIAKDVTDARRAAQELKDANQRLANLSNTDEMTGLFNFRFLTAEIKKEHERALRFKTPYSVILCDIDHFKNYNDKNGHLEGDIALKKTAAVLKERSRNTDLVARYGGEEFVIFCPGINAEKAQLLAEALRRNIEAEKFPHGEKQPLGKLTISIGVACYPDHGSTSNEVLRASDQALYHSKERGRNQVSVFARLKTLPKKAA